MLRAGHSAWTAGHIGPDSPYVEFQPSRGAVGSASNIGSALRRGDRRGPPEPSDTHTDGRHSVDREQQSSRGATRATPPKGQTKASKAKTTQSRAKATGESPATTAPDIMSRLPKSRPQRANQRRGATTRAAAKSPRARATAASPKTTAAAKRPVAAASRRATTPSASAASPAQAPARRPAPPAQGAPGLPRLALDGAAEAVMLPLKVSGRLTLRALDAVARGLRRR